MIIYQFRMIYNGEVKVSKAEYKLAKFAFRFNKELVYRKVKVIEKGVSRPGFPSELREFELGQYNYDTCYSDKYEDIYKFIESRKELFAKNLIELEYRKQKYMNMISNLDNSLMQIKENENGKL